MNPVQRPPQHQTSRTIGVITNNRHEVFQSKVIEGVVAEAGERGYEVEVASIAEDSAHPQSLTLAMDALSGIIVIANVLSDDDVRAIVQSGTPMTLISHQVADMPIPAVITDNEQGMILLMRHLVMDCGRRRLVFVGGDMRQHDAVEREHAFRRELMRYNLTLAPTAFVDGEFIPPLAKKRVARLIQSGETFDGLLAADYLMAIAACEALREAGIRVPEAVAVAGYGDGTEAERADLTTVAADVVEQGRRGTRQLIGQIDGLPIRGVTVLRTHLLVRQTTCSV